MAQQRSNKTAADSMARDGRDVKDKLVLVTGAGRGIGKRLAIGFASLGAHVAMVSRSKAELDLTHMEIQHAGGSSAKFAGSVTDREFLARTIDRASVQFSRPVSILICAAGVQGPIGPFVEAPPEAWAETIETNLNGTANTIRAALPGMISARFGKIVALTGGGVSRPRPYFSAYAASKAAIARFIESIAEELLDHNIQANCMSPGGSYTVMTDEILRAGESAGWRDLENARQVRLTGGVTADRQIALAAFLASSRSNHLTGRLIHVDDDWQKLADTEVHPESYTLRRNVKS